MESAALAVEHVSAAELLQKNNSHNSGALARFQISCAKRFITLCQKSWHVQYYEQHTKVTLKTKLKKSESSVYFYLSSKTLNFSKVSESNSKITFRVIVTILFYP